MKISTIVKDLFDRMLATKRTTGLTGGTKNVDSVVVTAGGSGYVTVPTVVFSAGVAAGTAVLSGGVVVSVTITNRGNYTVNPTVSFTGGGGTGAAGTVVMSPTSLDAIVSLDKTAGEFLVLMNVGTTFYPFRLRAGTDAEASPTIIRPDDYAGGTNEKVFELLSMSFGSISLPSSGTGLTLFATVDEVTNFEKLRLYYDGFSFALGSFAGGTGVVRQIKIGSTGYFGVGATILSGSRAAGDVGINSYGQQLITGLAGNSAGNQVGVDLRVDVGQSSTASYSALQIRAVETAIGSGLHLLIDGRVGATQSTTVRVFSFDNAGNLVTSGSLTTGAPAGGTAKPWKLGAVAAVTPTAQNRTIEVEIDGTTYYLTAKTTND